MRRRNVVLGSDDEDGDSQPTVQLRSVPDLSNMKSLVGKLDDAAPDITPMDFDSARVPSPVPNDEDLVLSDVDGAGELKCAEPPSGKLRTNNAVQTETPAKAPSDSDMESDDDPSSVLTPSESEEESEASSSSSSSSSSSNLQSENSDLDEYEDDDFVEVDESYKKSRKNARKKEAQLALAKRVAGFINKVERGDENEGEDDADDSDMSDSEAEEVPRGVRLSRKQERIEAAKLEAKLRAQKKMSGGSAGRRLKSCVKDLEKRGFAPKPIDDFDDEEDEDFKPKKKHDKKDKKKHDKKDKKKHDKKETKKCDTSDVEADSLLSSRNSSKRIESVGDQAEAAKRKELEDAMVNRESLIAMALSKLRDSPSQLSKSLVAEIGKAASEFMEARFRHVSLNSNSKEFAASSVSASPIWTWFAVSKLNMSSVVPTCRKLLDDIIKSHESSVQSRIATCAQMALVQPTMNSSGVIEPPSHWFELSVVEKCGVVDFESCEKQCVVCGNAVEPDQVDEANDASQVPTATVVVVMRYPNKVLQTETATICRTDLSAQTASHPNATASIHSIFVLCASPACHCIARAYALIANVQYTVADMCSSHMLSLTSIIPASNTGDLINMLHASEPWQEYMNAIGNAYLLLQLRAV